MTNCRLPSRLLKDLASAAVNHHPNAPAGLDGVYQQRHAHALPPRSEPDGQNRGRSKASRNSAIHLYPQTLLRTGGAFYL